MELTLGNYVALYVLTLIVFLGIDAVWLKYVMYDLFHARIGDLMRENTQFAVAAVFYLFYVIGIVYFAVVPGIESGSPWVAFFNGAFLGLLAYGTYESTNMATLRGWDWTMVAVDTSWGAVLTGVSAVGGLMLARWTGFIS